MKPKFVQITAGDAGLFALDDQGGVWKYIGAKEFSDKTLYAMWVKLTEHRKDRTGRRK